MMRLSCHKSRFSSWKRFIHEGVQQQRPIWIEPDGYKTNVSVYNSIKKSTVPLILKNENIATWYLCGPTVYDSAHIGHACTYVRFDIIRRILTKFFGIKVVAVMGITDIDDKIIARAAASQQDWKQLTKHYEQEFHDEMRLLNVTPPYLYCRVTDYIPQIIRFVEKIVSTNGAYIGKDGSVYFDTTSYNKYGKLWKPPSCQGHSVKKSNLDFALWKASKPGEPFWESPWGPGRPGWHIECSAIASNALGSSIDIHSGGMDLIFPHHENEEAQSCCYHDIDQWINYWFHTGHLFLSGEQKMSKSLKNTISIQEILKNYTPNQFRLFCLLTQYRNDVEFSPLKMQGAVATLKRIEYFLSDCRNYVCGNLTSRTIDESLVLQTLKATKEKVYSALANDFDTANVVFAIQELVALVNKMMHESEISKDKLIGGNTSSIAAVAEYIKETYADLGMSEATETQGHQNQLTEVIDNFVNFRCLVRGRALEQTVKDKFLLEASDTARKNLSACGIQVKDYKNTSTWTLTKVLKGAE